ncbi:MAG: thiamine phosphate synthase [Candidatus Omnitrophica bacterium]|nr:thiamine phosphate synthase [Candidatus Omnitrophota bacterium]
MNSILKPPLYIIKKILNMRVLNIIQLRDKYGHKSEILSLAKSIKNILNKSDILFIINDYIDIVKLVDADGIHLGQNDLPVSLVRKLIGKDKIIGLSCHSLSEAIKAQEEDVDYISIGPIFKTPLKPDYMALGVKILKKLQKQITIPYFPIGGIDLSNIEKIISLGINRIAISRLLGRADNLDFVITQLEQKF